MGKSKLVEWLDADGKRLRGALLLPSGYEPGRKYPLVVDVYGGGVLSDAFDWFGGPDRGMPYLNTQLLATRGYAVFMPDAPQSVGTPMLDLAKTVLPGVNRVIEMGIADPDRLGVMGHSYGGYSTLALLVQTKRFKAAVEANGMANLIGLYGEMSRDGSAFGTSAETDQELMGGSPWQFPTRYVENSPLFYLDRVETPLLVMHGEDDTTISSFLGDEIFVALRRLGKVVVYAKYRGEDHELMSYSNQLDSCKRMLDWFEEYMKPGSLAVDSKRVRARAGL
jgi:dipeptidyl aminopeptidase/acylaminoacyl peptidase